MYDIMGIQISTTRIIAQELLTLLYLGSFQAGDERGGVRLPGAGDHQEPREEVLPVHQLPHLRVGQQGDYLTRFRVQVLYTI